MATPTKVESKVKPGLAGIESNLPSVAPVDPERLDQPEEPHVPAHVGQAPAEIPLMNMREMQAAMITEPGAKQETRYVRVLKTSYLHGVICEPGQVTLWPTGVEKLGPNLEEYHFKKA